MYMYNDEQTQTVVRHFDAKISEQESRILTLELELSIMQEQIKRLASIAQAGGNSLASTKSPTTPATLMVERSQDVPYETKYPPLSPLPHGGARTV